jgi:hypothetical protein
LRAGAGPDGAINAEITPWAAYVLICHRFDLLLPAAASHTSPPFSRSLDFWFLVS